MRLATTVALVLSTLAPTSSGETPPHNVLLIIVDNLRPQLASYDSGAATITPRLDAFAANATVFANANCQIAWCAPSRNSFLSGRRPAATRAWNFLDDFRGAGPDWTTLPGYFLHSGYYATATGKVFHPDLPRAFDYPASWSDAVDCPSKKPCPNGTMACALPAGDADVDAAAADALIARLAARPAGRPFFAALGLQGPRLHIGETRARQI
jgi:hypothetical protein